MATLFIPSLWVEAIVEKIMGGKAVIPGSMPLGGNPSMKTFPKLTAELEAFFVAFALENGTHPEPTYGIDRDRLLKKINVALTTFGATPGAMQTIVEQYRATYNTFGDAPPDAGYLFEKLASCYLDWLYDQPESKKLAAEALAKAANKEGINASGIFGYKVVDYMKDSWGYDG